MSQFIETHLRDLANSGRSPHTIRNYRRVLRTLPMTEPQAVTLPACVDAFRNFLSARKRSHSDAVVYVAALRGLVKWLCRTRQVDWSLADRVDLDETLDEMTPRKPKRLLRTGSARQPPPHPATGAQYRLG